MFYRVRKSWDQPDSQIGAFTILKNALLQAALNPGYMVFDEDGNVVFDEDGAQKEDSNRERDGEQCDRNGYTDR